MNSMNGAGPAPRWVRLYVTEPYRCYVGRPRILASLDAEVAEDETARRMGLSDRRVLHVDQGMLFVNRGYVTTPFTNARTYLPLDLSLLDRRGRILEILPMRSIEKDPRPASYRPRYAYHAALETLRGLLPSRGVRPGSVVLASASCPFASSP